MLSVLIFFIIDHKPFVNYGCSFFISIASLYLLYEVLLLDELEGHDHLQGGHTLVRPTTRHVETVALFTFVGLACELRFLGIAQKFTRCLLLTSNIKIRSGVIYSILCKMPWWWHGRGGGAGKGKRRKWHQRWTPWKRVGGNDQNAQYMTLTKN